MLGRGNPIQESQIDEKNSRAADSFWSAFQMMENGRVKSTLMLYSFRLCWVFAAVHGAAIALYRGGGFVQVGRRRRYYADTGEDALVLECPLAGQSARCRG